MSKEIVSFALDPSTLFASCIPYSNPDQILRRNHYRHLVVALSAPLRVPTTARPADGWVALAVAAGFR